MPRTKVSDAAIVEAIRAAGNCRREAARRLGISYQVLYDRLDRMPIELRQQVQRPHHRGIGSLWDRYAADRSDVELRNRLIEIHAGVVKRALLAWATVRNLPDFVDRGAMLSAGYQALIGLVEAYDPARGVKFSTYAMPRLHGAFLDELRASDHAKRSQRSLSRQREEAEVLFAHKHSRQPTQDEVREILGWDTKTHQRSRPVEPLSMSQPIYTGGPGDRQFEIEHIVDDKRRSPKHRKPGSKLARLEWLDDLTRGMELESRFALYLYFFRQYRMHEIATILDLSESRVSQMVSKAAEWIRENRDRDEVLEAMP